MKHLAIFKGEAAQLILAGKKTIESRFSSKKNVPFLQISAGDLVYIKPSGKDIIGQFRVKKVIFYDGMRDEDLVNIKNTFGDAIVQSNEYWKAHRSARYGTLIFIGEVDVFITSPIKFPKKDLRGWVVLE